ncbi:MAG TPA: hypothetical protein VGB82_09520 [Alphaproteobacteria bacterium]
MTSVRCLSGVMALCVGLSAGAAWADNDPAANPFVGRWHWNRAQSTLAAGEPIPDDMTAEISDADGLHLKWSLAVLPPPASPAIESFNAPANGDFYPVSSDTTAAFRLTRSSLRATFKSPNGETDAMTCTVAADQKTMRCRGVLSDEAGNSASYVDVYDRM